MVNAGAIVCTSLIKVKAATLFISFHCAFLCPACVSFPLTIPRIVGITERTKVNGNIGSSLNTIKLTQDTS